MVFFKKKKKDEKSTRVVRGQGNRNIVNNPNRGGGKKKEVKEDVVSPTARGQGNKLIATNPNRRRSSGKTTTAATEKAAWLKKTRNSPAAKAGISDDMRWNAYQKNKKRLKV